MFTADIDVSVASHPSFPDKLPVATGAVFTEESYQRGELVLKQFYADQGYAFVESERKAEIVLDSDQAFIAYRDEIPAPGVFGSTVIDGARAVAPLLSFASPN